MNELASSAPWRRDALPKPLACWNVHQLGRFQRGVAADSGGRGDDADAVAGTFAASDTGSNTGDRVGLVGAADGAADSDGLTFAALSPRLLPMVPVVPAAMTAAPAAAAAES